MDQSDVFPQNPAVCPPRQQSTKRLFSAVFRRRRLPENDCIENGESGRYNNKVTLKTEKNGEMEKHKIWTQ